MTRRATMLIKLRCTNSTHPAGLAGQHPPRPLLDPGTAPPHAPETEQESEELRPLHRGDSCSLTGSGHGVTSTRCLSPNPLAPWALAITPMEAGASRWSLRHGAGAHQQAQPAWEPLAWPGAAGAAQPPFPPPALVLLGGCSHTLSHSAGVAGFC